MLAQHVAVQRPWSAVPIGAGMVQFARGVRSGVITRVGSPVSISVCTGHVIYIAHTAAAGPGPAGLCTSGAWA